MVPRARTDTTAQERGGCVKCNLYSRSPNLSFFAFLVLLALFLVLVLFALLDFLFAFLALFLPFLFFLPLFVFLLCLFLLFALHGAHVVCVSWAVGIQSWAVVGLNCIKGTLAARGRSGGNGKTWRGWLWCHLQRTLAGRGDALPQLLLSFDR